MAFRNEPLRLPDRLFARAAAGIMAFLFFCGCAHGKAVKQDDYHWTGAERVVAIADLHGDYDQYLKVLRSADLINSRERWAGGGTHLVQTGDIPDRGPDTQKIIAHIAELKKQAARKGGMVHTLIGNHEAMNTYGDLRYVHPGEFAAFVTRNSEAYREKQWEFQLERLKQVKPEEFLIMDMKAYRAEWEERIPLGWVEHRLAWSPPGEYGQWVMGNPVAVMVNGTLFLHGGISPKYCRLSLQEITEQAHARLENYDSKITGITDDNDGPLWYRGLAREDEEYFTPAVDQILERYGARRIVVGHTPTGGIVWPRFDGRVVVNDTGIATHYGANDAYLELTDEGAKAGYGKSKLELPADTQSRLAYLQEVIRLRPENESLKARLAEMTAPVVDMPLRADQEAASAATAGEPTEQAVEAPRPPISPGICQ